MTPMKRTNATARMLAIGDPMPDVTLQGDAGTPVRLRDLVKSGGLVVYFYPRDDSMGCTAQSCSFRDQYEDFLAAGADVVGISADGPASHDRFAAKHRLPFQLLSDGTGEGRSAFGVKSTLGLIAGRVTFVFDARGTVRYVFDSQIRVNAHVERALEVVRGLADARP
jgi:thioredoxin-dependent peroxiredoxin